MTFDQKLVTLRKQAGLSQEQLAEKLSVSRQAVSKWETGDTLPDTAKVIQLSRLFDVTIDYLLKEEETTPAAENVLQESEPATPPVSEGEPAPQVVQTLQLMESPQRRERAKWIAGWILTGLGSLGYLVLWVLSTMIISYEDYSYLEDGVVWYSIRDGYSWAGFVDRYRLEALLWILGILLAAGLLLLLGQWLDKLTENKTH